MNRLVLFICLCIAYSYANEQYQCYISHDLNVVSWKLLSYENSDEYNQVCDSFGYVPLVKNDYIFYKMMISEGQLQEAEFYFYNGIAAEAVCLLLIAGDNIHPSDNERCQNEGIVWTKKVYGTDIFLKIDYIKANFSTILRKMNPPCDDGRFYDIYIWQPKYLVDQSTGICKANDVDCRSASLKSQFSRIGGREICESLPLSTTTTTTITATAVPVTTYKCSIYENVYVETWSLAVYPISQSTKPYRSCSGTDSIFQLIKNDYIEYILQTDGSTIQQLILHLFDPMSTELICNVLASDTYIHSNYCDQNGLAPIVVQTATHKTLTIKYPRANFTTNVIIDISVFIGRFVIENFLEPELSSQSTGICDRTAPCTIATDAFN